MLPTLTLNEWIITITPYAVLIGIFFANFFNSFSKEKKEKVIEDEALDEKLLKKYKEYSKDLEDQVGHLTEQQEKHKKEIAETRGKYDAIVQIFQGRDPNSQKFQEEGFKAIQLASTTHTLIVSLAEATKQLVANSTELKNAIINIENNVKEISDKLEVNEV